MARRRKLETPVTLFAAIEAEQHEALREIAFARRQSLADIVREALAEYVNKERNLKPSGRRRAAVA